MLDGPRTSYMLVGVGELIENTVYDLRMRADKTQEEVASALGVSRQTVIAIEKGNYTPSVLLALKIARYFDTPLEKIFKIKYEK